MSATSHWHCALCGAPARAPFRPPRPDVAPDLDLRPGEPARSMLQDWLQRCSACGAVAPDASALPPAAKQILQSTAYQTLLTSVSEETLPFRRWAMICRGSGAAHPSQVPRTLLACAATDVAQMLPCAWHRNLS